MPQARRKTVLEAGMRGTCVAWTEIGRDFVDATKRPRPALTFKVKKRRRLVFEKRLIPPLVEYYPWVYIYRHGQKRAWWNCDPRFFELHFTYSRL